MTRELIIHEAGPGLTIQDRGRPGYLDFGLSHGGAADLCALAEGAALLRQGDELAALEMAVMGGEFEVSAPTRIALTGAVMPASIDGAQVAWNASHLLEPGARLKLGTAAYGVYGYLHVGGGAAAPQRLGSRSTHIGAGLGNVMKAGDRVPIGDDNGTEVGLGLAPAARFEGGPIRVIKGPQSKLFSSDELTRFAQTSFSRSPRGNRMGVGLGFEGGPFQTETGLSILSEIIVPGDIQITGDGTPFILLSECGTTGGYPRIGSVVPSDLPKVAQAQPSTAIQFQFVSLEEAVEAERTERERRATLRADCFLLVRDPHSMDNLLSLQLVSGVTAGDDLERKVQ